MDTLVADWSPRVDISAACWGLSATEFNVQLCLIYTGEVGNGGHTQLFQNRGGAVASRVLDALREVSLLEHADILSAAVSAFPDSRVPLDYEELDDALEKIGDSKLDELDRAFFNLPDHVDATLLNYIRMHAEDVLRPERGLDSEPTEPPAEVTQ